MLIKKSLKNQTKKNPQSAFQNFSLLTKSLKNKKKKNAKRIELTGSEDSLPPTVPVDHTGSSGSISKDLQPLVKAKLLATSSFFFLFFLAFFQPLKTIYCSYSLQNFIPPSFSFPTNHVGQARPRPNTAQPIENDNQNFFFF